MMVSFYIGLSRPGDARHFKRSCISINRLVKRCRPVGGAILIDSGAFSAILRHGGFPEPVAAYAAHLRRLHGLGVIAIAAAVAQDFMCEPVMLERTGLSIADHQRLTIERYDELVDENLPFPIMPVLQGYQPGDYADHVRAYGDRLGDGQWVGVGSVCKRNGAPEQIIAVLSAILAIRPDLRLHGFGVKKTALVHPGIRAMLHSADSMAWSFAARKQGRDRNSWREAKAFADHIEGVAARAPAPWQMPLPLWSGGEAA
jgi:hypothetical protein